MSDLTQQLIEQVNSAIADQQPLSIVGNNTKAFLRANQNNTLPKLSLTGHRGITSYKPVELVMTARAGTPLTEIEAALAEHGQMLPCESPLFATNSHPGATIGGTLAANISGPARPWCGSIRDLTLGIKLINGKGEHLTFGGQVMKNVAGYDVSRLQAGAMGSLGVITEISFKVLPKPATTRTLVIEIDAAGAIRMMNKVSAQPKPLTGACWVGGHLYLRLAGANSAVEETLKQWPGEQLDEDDHFWHNIREMQLAHYQNPPLWRFSIASTAEHFLPDETWIIDWGGAQRWLRGEFNAKQLQTFAQAAGGHVSLFKGQDHQRFQEIETSSVKHHLYRQLKAAFDPLSLFNPALLHP